MGIGRTFIRATSEGRMVGKVIAVSSDNCSSYVAMTGEMMGFLSLIYILHEHD